MQIKKRHQTGAARNFITRTQAVKKLQISLADFRRLCIFKGIYPREPRNKKKANKGSTAPVTFYYTKDIQYLMHEPILQKFRDHKMFARKLTRALGRGDVSDAKRLDDNRPRYTLERLVKERYPSFSDAIRDLDDALSMLFLFAAIPANNNISSKVTAFADKLCHEWMAYIARERLLTKVFVSIKGVYYEAEVMGQVVRWLVPFKFPQNVPIDVDFRIMSTFLEFYQTLLQLVLVRLYKDAGLVYPPKIDQSKAEGVAGLSAFILESNKTFSALPPSSAKIATDGKQSTAKVNTKDLEKKIHEVEAKQQNEDENENNVVEEEEEEEGEARLDRFKPLSSNSADATTSDILAQPVDSGDEFANLFKNMTFFVGREVPIDMMEFLITAFGGKIISEAALDSLIDANDENDENTRISKALAAVTDSSTAITHQISDRPVLSTRMPGRAYIQPQWIFDSINQGKLLAVTEYAPGEILPPHLSPWGDSTGYDPTKQIEPTGEDEQAENEAEEEEEEEVELSEDDDEDDEEESDEEDEVEEVEAEDDEHERELASEARGIAFSETTEKKSSKPIDKEAQEAKEEQELRKMMMTNKQRKLYEKMQYGIKRKEAGQESLINKKRKLEKAKKRQA